MKKEKEEEKGRKGGRREKDIEEGPISTLHCLIQNDPLHPLLMKNRR